jgi:hypothetical protein
MNLKDFRGDLSTLDLVGVFQTLGYPATETAPNKYWVKCPWSHEHSFNGRSDTVIWQQGDTWPEFLCSHNHCRGIRKLDEVLEWAEAQRPGTIDEHCSSNWVRGQSRPRSEYTRTEQIKKAEPVKKVSPEEAIQNAERFLNGFRIDEADLYHASAAYPGEDWRTDSIQILECLYSPQDFICLCTDYDEATKKDGSIKARPVGAGMTRTAADWIRHIQDRGTPESKSGAWIRLNPVKERGSGKGEAHTDADVTDWRFMLLESDALPIDLQISLFAALALPIACLCTSGGQSVHAWVKLDSRSEHEFRADVDRVLSRLSLFGVDTANSNPSRYGRAPGAFRSIGAQPALRDDAGQQRLLYLNPSPSERPIFS